MITKANIMAATSDANAAVGEILIPKIAYVKGRRLVGTMPNNAGDVDCVSYHRAGTVIHVIPAQGYMDGSDDASKATLNLVTGINCFKDGSFYTTTTHYAGGSTLGISNHVMSVTGNGSTADPHVGQLAVVTESTHKYYIKARMRVTNSSCTNIWAGQWTGDGYVTQASPIQNQWYTLSAVKSSYTNASFVCGHSYANSSTANGKVLEVTYVVAVDLTVAYGAGNEPNAATMDEIFDTFFATNEYFEGSATWIP